jgi:hypothetical protein
MKDNYSNTTQEKSKKKKLPVGPHNKEFAIRMAVACIGIRPDVVEFQGDGVETFEELLEKKLIASYIGFHTEKRATEEARARGMNRYKIEEGENYIASLDCYIKSLRAIPGRESIKEETSLVIISGLSKKITDEYVTRLHQRGYQVLAFP